MCHIQATTGLRAKSPALPSVRRFPALAAFCSPVAARSEAALRSVFSNPVASGYDHRHELVVTHLTRGVSCRRKAIDDYAFVRSGFAGPVELVFRLACLERQLRSRGIARRPDRAGVARGSRRHCLALIGTQRVPVASGRPCGARGHRVGLITAGRRAAAPRE